ncbi:HAMP domain-containing protein/HPt (histidine-containing phosphotransfer) domain-containing protein [Paraburkholderia bannensis]|uniref:Chemotaxis protein CheA n=1 Tax=Paraburkholderia bannensis TaxID=765414 RepID=A0A7W9WWX5_9BURK|nr:MULTISPECIES: HAMP domain-containing protein [Paraburkholderia]MBB3261532.1 HAMP domain-containing protein/HPt (histidine-containing phosphotransfer) domain-containing protein [Paraburkholderia sp. WP4_3_2]MBB6106588.1 HAMP domain-containing protein/HPt (histidine-containing phosphotransfer) domain-containing protein [Paraburkholderia bannensis]
MTIRHRITLLIALMFVALSAIGGYAVYQTRRSATDVHQVTQGVVPSALASSDLVSLVKDVQLATMTLVYAPDATTAQLAQDDLKKKETALRAALDVQKQAAASHAQDGLVAQAQESITNYFNAIDDTAKMKAAGKNELAQAYLFANVAQYRDELEGIVTTMRVEKNRQKDDAINALNGMLDTTTSAIAGVTGGAVVLLTAIGLLLYRQITRPLSRMQEEMSEIASNQDFTRRVPVGRMDEIGHSIVAFNGMIEKIQHSSAQLKRKTADIQAMLQNMQQGILTVVEGATVHNEYSAYLEAIFETKEIAGRSLMDLVFSHTELDADTLSQIDAAVQACLGEDDVNFAFNQHLLVNEVTRTMPDGRKKVLDLSWSAITDENDVVVRLMLCVRDVTELRELAAEAGEQKRRLQMIGEILAVSEEKFHNFVEGATGFIHENERIIRQHDCADMSAIDALFRNMHTIKGNARTYSLQHLTGVVHEVEQRYDALRRADTSHAWDQQALIDDLHRVREAVDHYATLNEVSLGRGARSKDEGLSIGRDQIDASLRLLDSANQDDIGSLRAMREELRSLLGGIGTESVEDALAGVIDSLPSLAQELDKAAPVVRIDDGGYRLRAEAAGTVSDVFTHLLRNSLDHGIETPAQRRELGKAEAGHIDIKLAMSEGALRIALADDGRGLALARIRGIATGRGWLGADETISDEDIAAFIFRAGFSTAHSVTEVSGRGVGMDAVRDFLEREGGRIELRFTDNREGADYRHFETIVYLPQSCAVAAAPARAAVQEEALA